MSPAAPGAAGSGEPWQTPPQAQQLQTQHSPERALGAACLSSAVHLRAAGMPHQSVPVTNSTEVMQGSNITSERDSNTQTPTSWGHGRLTALGHRRTCPVLQCLPGLRVHFLPEQDKHKAGAGQLCGQCVTQLKLTGSRAVPCSLPQAAWHTQLSGDYQLCCRLPALSVITSVLLHTNASFPAAPLNTCQSIHPWACCSPK